MLDELISTSIDFRVNLNLSLISQTCKMLLKSIFIFVLFNKLVFTLLTSISGIIHQMKGEYEAALKLHKAHLSFAQELNDYAAQGRAYGNMGNAYHALSIYDQAVRYHRQELQISLEVNSWTLHPKHVTRH